MRNIQELQLDNRMESATTLDTSIPFNSAAEAELLGIIMRENAVLDALQFLRDSHFYAPAHQRIFVACRARIADGDLATPVTLASMFRDDPDLPTKERYLAQCVGMVSGGTLKAIQLARYVQDLAQRRDLIVACQKAMADATDQSLNVVDIATALSHVTEQVMAGEKKWEMRKGTEVTQSIIDNMKNNVKPYSTGIDRLDRAMGGGLYAGKLYGFAGKKKHGKTILGGTVSVNLAIRGVKHLFICGEMSDEEVQQRNLARMGNFYPKVFRNDDTYSKSEEFQQKFNDAMHWSQDNIIFINAPALTFDKLKHIVKQAVLRHNIKGFILDYWQLVGGKEGKKSTAEHLDEVAQWLADTAKKYGLFVISMAQINQEGNTRGSEGLRLACDQLYELNRPQLEQPGMWLKMMDTRYTAWADVGEENNPKLVVNPYGPHIEELS